MQQRYSCLQTAHCNELNIPNTARLEYNYIQLFLVQQTLSYDYPKDTSKTEGYHAVVSWL